MFLLIKATENSFDFFSLFQISLLDPSGACRLALFLIRENTYILTVFIWLDSLEEIGSRSDRVRCRQDLY